MQRRRFIQGALAGAATPFLPMRLAQAQIVDQPRIFYGFPAGSSGDILSRRIAEKFAGTAYSRNNGIVENRPGAGGRIALEALKAAPADGSSMALAPFSTTAIYPHIYSKLSYTPDVDFVPVSIAAMVHHGLAVGPMVPASVRDLRGFLAWAKENPKQANYGSPAAGSTPHFIGAMLGLNTNTPLNHVPYRGSVPGVADVIGGQIASMVTPHGDFVANHKAGKLRILATSGKNRSPFVPEVATFAEQGFADLVVEEWFGFYMRAGSPANAIASANAVINAALKDKGVIDGIGVVGLIAQGSTPDEMARSQRAEHERWGPIVKRIGFTADS